MRFNVSDWLWLILATAVASVAMTGVDMTVVRWAARTATSGFASSNLLTALALASGVASVLLDALAVWLVLRWGVEGLRLGPWLLATVLGLLLSAIVGLPAAALLVPTPEGGSWDLSGPSGAYFYAPIRWLMLIAASAATFLPPGLLLRRLSGASALPFVAAGVTWTILANPISRPATDAMLRYIGQLALSNAGVWQILGAQALPLAAIVAMGALSGLTLGAGLFLMARLPVRPADAG
jgi:hypothetical protein